MTDTLNGVDRDRLTHTRDAAKSDATKREVAFRGLTRWESGAYSRTRVREFELTADEPEFLAGTDRAPNAVEEVLAALGSCLVVGFVYGAADRGITLDSLEIEFTGDLDLRGFLGLDKEVRPGLLNAEVRYHVHSDAPRERIEELIRHVERTSPVTDTLRRPVPVTTVLAECIQVPAGKP